MDNKHKCRHRCHHHRCHGHDCYCPHHHHSCGHEVAFLPHCGTVEAVITCVNHADFLAHTLPINTRHFDDLVVVTAPEDKDTQRVARFWGVKCILTDVFRTRWGEFCKGMGINEGLKALTRKDWVVHMDVDLALPPVFRSYVDKAKLDKGMIYGLDRAEFKSYKNWQQFIGNPQLHTAGNASCFIDVHHHGQRLGTRVYFGHREGYVPLGFFQMWNPAGSGVYEYQQGHTDAAREDNEFSCQWPRAKRGFLPEVIAYHLESEDAPMAVNWKGRQTKPFQVE